MQNQNDPLLVVPLILLNSKIGYTYKIVLDNYEHIAPIAYSVVCSDSNAVVVWPHR
jgi:hypothetical protein